MPLLQFIQRQIGHDPRSGAFLDDDLVHVAEHALDGFEIHALAGHFRRLAVFLVNVVETLRLTAGFCGDAGGVAAGFFKDALRLAARFGYDLIGVLARLLDDGGLILLSRLNVSERFVHIVCRRLGKFQVHQFDLHAPAIDQLAE